MDLNKALEILKQHNKWRREKQHITSPMIPMIEPKLIGEAIDTIVLQGQSYIKLISKLKKFTNLDYCYSTHEIQDNLKCINVLLNNVYPNIDECVD